MKKKVLFRNWMLVVHLWLLGVLPISAQTENVGIGTTTPDNSALLELFSTNRGFLVPRMTTAQRNSIATPATGLLIYNSDNQRFEYYNGTQWVAVVSSLASVPFNLISTGTNSTATMTVGSGSSILLGGGTIEANVFEGTGSTTDAVDLATSEVAGLLPISNGGTGVSSIPSNGQLLIGNGSGYTVANLVAGSGVTITNGPGSITIADANSASEVTGSGSTSQVSFWNGTNTITGDNGLWWDNTNKRLGIGTTTPSQVLDISGNVQFSGALMPNGSPGTSGQILSSQGSGSPPQWVSASSLETDPVYNSEKTTIVFDGDAAGGDLSGTYPNPSVAKIQGTNVSNTLSPTSGQVLKWSGTEWVASSDDNTTYTAGDALSLTGTEFDVLYDNTTIGLNGSNQLYLKDNAVTSAKIVDGSIVDADISSSAGIDATKIGSGNVNNTEFGYLDGVTSNIQGQLNGKEPSIAAGTTSQYWRGDKTWVEFPTSLPPSGTAGGDLSGTYPNPSVVKIQGRNVASTAPTNGQAYIWNNTSQQWEPGNIGTVSSVGLSMPGEFSITGSPVTSSGTISVSWGNQSANTVFAGPTSGIPSPPSFRSLTDDDIPDNITASNYLPLSGGTMTGTITFAGGQQFPGTVTGTGTNDEIALWNGTSSLTSNAQLKWDGTNNRLVIQNSLQLNNSGTGSNTFSTGSGQSSAISYTLPSALPSSSGFLQSDNSGNLSWQSVPTLPSGTNGQTLRYNSGWEATNLIYHDLTNSRVGINITSPNALLHQDEGTSTATYHKFTAGTTTGTGSGDGFDVGVDGSGNAHLKQNENLPMIFATNATERIRLLGNGKVGIGTSTINDDSLLVQVNGDVLIDGDLVVTGNIDPKVIYFEPLGFTPTVVSQGAVYYDDATDKLRLYDGTSWNNLVSEQSLSGAVQSVAWTTTGNSGMNESTNFIGTVDNVGFKIKTNNSDRIFVGSDGKVGIATNNPSSTFSVEGSISNKVTVVTGNTTLDETHHTILANSTSNLTITLPAPSSSNVGRIYVIKNINTGVVTISGAIDDSTLMSLRQRGVIELISNGSNWVVYGGNQPVPPIGSIIAWHKSMSGTPSLPYGWVECNGQTLNDVASPYHNQTIPNLNGNPSGANSPGLSEKASMFLRGGTTSGTGQNDAFQGHKHSITSNAIAYSYGGLDVDEEAEIGLPSATIEVGNPISDGTNGTPRTANETRPKNMTVVWIMRVK